MAQGRDGSLRLSRTALSSTTLCLLTGALRGSIASLSLWPVGRSIHASLWLLPRTAQNSIPAGWLGLGGEGIAPPGWMRFRLGAPGKHLAGIANPGPHGSPPYSLTRLPGVALR